MNMRNIILLTLIFFLALSVFPIPASAQGLGLVPCGRSDQQAPLEDGSVNPAAQCTVTHFVIAAIRLINYLISIAGLVAMYQIMTAGWNLIGSMGNAEKAQKAKSGISEAVVGFTIVVLAFVFINLLVNGIFGRGDPGNATQWWNITCLYDITNSSKDVNCIGS